MAQVKDLNGRVLPQDASVFTKSDLKSLLTKNGIALPSADKDKSVCLPTFVYQC